MIKNPGIKKISLSHSFIHSKEFPLIAFLGFMIIAAWIGFAIYRNLSTTNIPAEVQKQVKPLNPTVDSKALETLKDRRVFSNDELQEFPVMMIEKEEIDENGAAKPRKSPTPSPSPKTSPKPSAKPSPTASASAEPVLPEE
jgi:hypothetical protein